MEDAIKRYEVVISREIVDKFIEASNEKQGLSLAEEVERLSFAVVHTLIQALLEAVKNGKGMASKGSPIPDLSKLHGLLRTVELLNTWSDRMPHPSQRAARVPANPETLRTLDELRGIDPVDRELLRRAGEAVLKMVNLQFRKEKEGFESSQGERIAESSPDAPLENGSRSVG